MKPKLITPDFLDSQLWNDFKQHRKELGKPLTPTAERRLLIKLERMKNEGQNIHKAIETSIECGWRGIFDVKDDVKSDIPLKERARRVGVEPKPGESEFMWLRRVMEAERG